MDAMSVMPVQADADDVVGELRASRERDGSADRDGSAEQKIGGVERYVEIFDLPGHAGIRHRAFDPPAAGPARFGRRAVERCSCRDGRAANAEEA